MKPCPECERKNVKYYQKCLTCDFFLCEDCYLNKGIRQCEICYRIHFTFSLFKIYKDKI